MFQSSSTLQSATVDTVTVSSVCLALKGLGLQDFGVGCGDQRQCINVCVFI